MIMSIDYQDGWMVSNDMMLVAGLFLGNKHVLISRRVDERDLKGEG